MNFDTLFTNPSGRIPRAQFVPALITVLAAIAFFHFVVAGRTAQFCVLILLYPVFVLLSQRLQDIGYSAWLLLAPLALMVVSLVIQLGYISLGDTVDGVLPWVALAVSAVFLLWGCVSNGKK